MRTFVQPIIDYFASVGTPYVGVLYAGLMLTADGPRLIEYNCRFGDPETQAVLPLLENDLAELALACTSGTIRDHTVKVRDGAACTVVAASPGYPADPHIGATIQLNGFSTTEWANASTIVPEAILFPAAVANGKTAGGRVLAVTGLGADLAAARSAAYRGMDGVKFANMQVRRDIGWRAPGALLTSYASTGVDIDEGNRAVERMKGAVERTLGDDVLRGVGSFGGVISARRILELDDPVLVASADGVGTKVELAARLGKVRGVGRDIVNHCIDDVLVQSARPLFFLDYIAASKLDADLVAEVVTGMAEACEASGCVLLGGETAEMPGSTPPARSTWPARWSGSPNAAELLPRDDVAAGDVLIGVASSGPHTNGFSFLRKLFDFAPMDVIPPGFAGLARRRTARAAPFVPARARRCARFGEGQGTRPHHRWWSAREPAAGAARWGRRRDRVGFVAGWPVVRLDLRAGDRCRHPRAAPHAQHGDRHGRRRLPCRRRRRAGHDPRADVADRHARARPVGFARDVHLL